MWKQCENINFSNTDVILFNTCSYFKYQTLTINNIIYISDNYGKSFYVSYKFPNSVIYCGNIYISKLGKYQSIPIYSNRLYSGIIISKNYGKTWEYSTTTFKCNTLITSISGSISGKIQYLTIYGGDIWYTTNYGLVWKKTESGIGNWLCICNNKIAVNTSDNSLYICNDSGIMWKKSNIQLPEIIINIKLYMYGNNIILLLNNKYYKCKIKNDIDKLILYSNNEYNNIHITKLGKYQSKCHGTKISNSTDYGNTWKELNTINTPIFYYISNCGKYNILLTNTNMYYYYISEEINYNEKSLFMRGNNFTLPSLFYLVGRSQIENKYYYLSILNNDIYFSTTQDKNTLLNLKINKSYGGTYYFTSGNNNLIVSENETLELSSSEASSLLTFYSYKSMNNTIATYLYPGLWYKIFSSDMEIEWKTDILVINDDTNEETNIYEKFDIMFIPVNDSTDNGINSISIWENQKCISYLDNDYYGLELFNNWITNNTNAPTNCEGDVKVSDKSNNCYFKNMDDCNNGYLYNLAINDEQCGKNLGICVNSKACVYDYTTTNLSCEENPIEPVDPPDTNDYNLTTILVIFILIFIIIIVVFITVFKNNKEDD